MKRPTLLLLALLCVYSNNHGVKAESGDYEDVASGRISNAQCTAFTIQDSNSTDAMEASGIFYVASKSYMFFDYSGGGDNNDDDGSSYSNTMMVSLQTWMDSIATVKQGTAAPNCTQIENAKGVFSNSKGVQSLFAADTSTALYEGPICGMGADKKRKVAVVGVFLDSSCTLFAPKLMYKYRKKVRRNKVSSDISSAVEVVAASSKKTLSCNKYAFCGQLLGNSVSTQFCDQDGNGRWLENGQEDNFYYAASTNNETSSNTTSSWFSNIWNKNGDGHNYNGVEADYSEGSYQLSQSDLYDMGSTCYAAVTSMDEGVTLESYLLHHGQLRANDPKTAAQIVKMIVLILVGMMGAYLLFTNVKIRRVKKNKQLPKELDTDSDESSAELSSTFATMEEGPESETFATMQTEMTGDTLASTLRSQVWNDLNIFKQPQTLQQPEDQGQAVVGPAVQRATTSQTSNTGANSPKAQLQKWRYSLTHMPIPDDRKMPLVTEADEGVVEFGISNKSASSFDRAETVDKPKKSSWRPSLRNALKKKQEV